MPPRARSFGAVAEDYEQFRLTYRDELFTALAQYVGDVMRPVEVLEVGAGTGKATVSLLERAYRVTAVEPDPQMRAVLGQRTQGLAGVDIVDSDFESYVAAAPFDVLVAAASWHWTDAETRWSRAAGLLRSGGVIALLGNNLRPAGVEVQTVFDAATKPLLSSVPDRPGKGERIAGLRWPATDLLSEPDFTGLEVHGVVAADEVPRASFLGHLSTLSSYLIVPAADRDAAFRRLEAELPDPMPVLKQSQVVLARRR